MPKSSGTALQCPSNSMMENVRFGFNASVVAFSVICTLIGAINLLTSNINLTENKYTAHGLKYMYLFFSLWGSAVQTLYIYVLLSIDIIEKCLKNNTSTRLNKIRNKLKTFSSYVFFTAFFPMSVAICSLFWHFYFVDRELVYPSVLDEIYPSWVNHSMHTIPAGLAIIYSMFEKEPVPMKHTLLGMIAILTLYSGLCMHVRLRDNKWMYLFFHDFSDDRVTQMLSVLPLSCIFCTVLGHEIARAIQCVRTRVMTCNN